MISLKTLLILIVSIICWGTSSGLFAQSSCTYTLEMLDEFGDGWKDSKVVITSNGVSTTHTLATGFSGVSTFQVTHGAAVILNFIPGAFATEVAFNLLSPDGLVLYSSGPAGAPAPPKGELYFRPGICPSCPAPKLNSFTFSQISDSTALFQWGAVVSGKSYKLQYGPKGFLPGFGLSIDSVSSTAKLTGLNPDVEYDVYVLAICGANNTSMYIGPARFRTTFNPAKAGGSCTYTFELSDSGANGWNGSLLRAVHKGLTQDFTMAIGSSISHQFVATGNFPIEFFYIPGAAESEISYKIKDPSGNVIFSAGPFPASGKVFSTIACPTCPGPKRMWMHDVNANNAIVAWEPVVGATGNYLIEYGPLGFTLGKGKAVTTAVTTSRAVIGDLKENKWYDVYVKLNCGGTEFSKTVGPISFKTIWMNDIGVSGLAAPNFKTGCNFKKDEKLTISITNYGQVPQTLFKFLFAVNGVPAKIPTPQDGLYTGVVGNDSTYTIEFETPWDFSVPGLYFIDAWTELKGDSNAVNDTFRLTILTAQPKPLKEDFEDEAILSTWTYNGLIYTKGAHNNASNVLSKNLFGPNEKFSLTTHRVGPMDQKDSLLFEYRFVSFPDGKTAFTPGSKDKLEVQISTDCGATFQTVLTIDSLNHKPTLEMTRKVIQLGQFGGKAINVRFVGTWGKGDYWVDLDNINIPGCPASLYLHADLQASYFGAPNGFIDVKSFFGDQPLKYKWNTGDTTKVIYGLYPGIYRVTVTDANGCTDFRAFTIGLLVNDTELNPRPEIKLYPNPASDKITLDVSFPSATDFQLRLLNLNGQVLYQTTRRKESTIMQTIDLSPHPPGMYFVQITQNEKLYHAKLIITR